MSPSARGKGMWKERCEPLAQRRRLWRDAKGIQTRLHGLTKSRLLPNITEMGLYETSPGFISLALFPYLEKNNNNKKNAFPKKFMSFANSLSVGTCSMNS